MTRNLSVQLTKSNNRNCLRSYSFKQRHIHFGRQKILFIYQIQMQRHAEYATNMPGLQRIREGKKSSRNILMRFCVSKNDTVIIQVGGFQESYLNHRRTISQTNSTGYSIVAL